MCVCVCVYLQKKTRQLTKYLLNATNRINLLYFSYLSYFFSYIWSMPLCSALSTEEERDLHCVHTQKLYSNWTFMKRGEEGLWTLIHIYLPFFFGWCIFVASVHFFVNVCLVHPPYRRPYRTNIKFLAFLCGTNTFFAQDKVWWLFMRFFLYSSFLFIIKYKNVLYCCC